MKYPLPLKPNIPSLQNIAPAPTMTKPKVKPAGQSKPKENNETKM